MEGKHSRPTKKRMETALNNAAAGKSKEKQHNSKIFSPLKAEQQGPSTSLPTKQKLIPWKITGEPLQLAEKRRSITIENLRRYSIVSSSVKQSERQKPTRKSHSKEMIAESNFVTKELNLTGLKQSFTEKTKQDDAIDRSKEYTELIISFLILQLITHNTLKDFKLSSNNNAFQFFNHIVLEINWPSKHKQTFAIHIEYRNNTKDLNVSNYTKNKIENAEKILFTNDTNLTLNVVDKAILKSSRNPIFKKITERYYGYILENIELYVTPTIEKLEERTVNMFIETFCCDSTLFTKYLRFITKWNNIEGVKHKLNKTWVTRAIVSLIVSPYMIPLSFVQNNRKNKKFLKIFANTISTFHVTIFRKELEEEVKQIWSNIKFEKKQLEQIRDVAIRYQIISKFEDVSKLNNEEKSMVLWLMGECPLILKECETTYKAINLCQEYKFILLSEDSFYQRKLKNRSIFHDLSNLKKNHQIINAVTCSIQGKERVPLNNLLKESKFSNIITTNEIIQMLDESFIIGGEEKLISMYRPRSLINNGDATIQESELAQYKTKFNIISAKSGMGKSELVKSLKTYQSSDVWSIIINLKNHSQYFRSHPDANNFINYITKDYKNVEKVFFKFFKNEKRASFIWDNFHQVSKEALHNVVKIIKELQRQEFTQWIACRDNLDSFFKKEFQVSSKKMCPLKQDQARSYIIDRLEDFVKDPIKIADKYITFAPSILDDEFFGNPSQIFILTECLLQNSKQSEDTTSSLLDLFRYVIDYKFQKYYERIHPSNSNDLLRYMFEDFKNDRLKDYERIAINELGINSNCDDFFNEIKKDGDDCDILEVDSMQNPVFIHHSLQEYFAARYLKQNWKSTPNPDEILQKQHIVKTFYDLLSKNF